MSLTPSTSFLQSLSAHQSVRLSEQKWIEPTKSLAQHALTGGKFLRPQLFYTVLWGCEKTQVWSKGLMDVALSFEWVHAYSLIHDDLPCMDNDDFRRGRPTLHRLDTEAQALLVGDALLTAALGLLANAEGLSDKVKVLLIKELSFAAGGSQLIAGQVRDLKKDLYGNNLEEILQTHVLKTGALFGAASAMAALCVQSKNLLPRISEFRNWGRDFGVLYQLIDDLLDGDGAAILMSSSVLRQEITNRMESLSDRSKAQGWDSRPLIETFESLIWNQ